MNFVDFVIDCYSYITSHVSKTFTSCTHYTSYSLLNIVHVIVCVYGLTNQVLQIPWILCKINLMFENLWRMQEILILGILGLNSCFWKSYHLILMHFVLKFQCFELILNVFFSKNCVFPQIWWASAHFDRSILFFDRSKIFKYVWESLCLFRLIGLFFDRLKLVKHVFWKVRLSFSKGLFQKVFQPFLSLRLG